jgi:hypothetical protein
MLSASVKRFESLRSVSYEGSFRSLYEKLHNTFSFRSDSCIECVTWISSNILVRTRIHVRGPHTVNVVTNLGYDILTRTRGTAELWMRKGAMLHVCKFIITLFNIPFLYEVMFIFADQSHFPPKNYINFNFLNWRSLNVLRCVSVTRNFLNIIIFTKFT